MMQRLVIKFTKEKGAKFISHLDTLRTIHRAIRRAGIPIAYSKGFNPHPSISVAAPLSLGFSSRAEYADIELERYVEPGDILENLNNNLPDGMKVLNAINIEGKVPPSMALVNSGIYHIEVKHRTDLKAINKIIEEILNSKEIVRLKKTKSGEKNVDLRPLIKGIKVENISTDTVVFECDLLTGSKGTISPEMLVEIIKDYSKDLVFGYAAICRMELYTDVNGKSVELESYFSGK